VALNSAWFIFTISGLGCQRSPHRVSGAVDQHFHPQRVQQLDQPVIEVFRSAPGERPACHRPGSPARVFLHPFEENGAVHFCDDVARGGDVAVAVEIRLDDDVRDARLPFQPDQVGGDTLALQQSASVFPFCPAMKLTARTGPPSVLITTAASRLFPLR